MNNYVSTKIAREKLQVSDDTLRRWADNGQIKYVRTPGNHRLYDVESFITHGTQRETESRKEYDFTNKDATEFIVLNSIFKQPYKHCFKNPMKEEITTDLGPIRNCLRPNVLSTPRIHVIQPVHITGISKTNSLDFPISRSSDGIKSFNVIGPLDKIISIQLCLIHAPDTVPHNMLQTLEQQSYNQFNTFEVIDTVDKQMIDIMHTMFGYKCHEIVSMFIYRLQDGIINFPSAYSRFMLRLNIQDDTSLFSVACHSVILSNEVRRDLLGKLPFSKIWPYQYRIETVHPLLIQSLDNAECNKINVSVDGVLALFISIWNKTKNKYELDSLNTVSLVFDTYVYRCLTKVDVQHHQVFACGNTGEHIILAFNQNILQQNPNMAFSGYINFSAIPGSHILIDLMDDLQDEYEVHINYSKITGLIFQQGKITLT